MAELNLTYYKGNDKSQYYFLNNIDQKNLDLLKNMDIPEFYNKIPKEISHFLNPKRANLFDRFEFGPNDDILIVNDFLGFVTKKICDKVNSVSVVEFSKAFAEITDARLFDKENVEIFVGDAVDISFKKGFDYVILIDIYESDNPEYSFKNKYTDFLEYFDYFLKTNGSLMFVSSNKFGLKNWAGAIDERFGIPYLGLGLGQKFPPGLFTKNFYKKMLYKAGFSQLEFFYPVPSHFAPDCVLSDEELEGASIDRYFQNYALYEKKNFNEQLLIKDLLENNKFDLFANSYLIVANNKENGEISEYNQFEL